MRCPNCGTENAEDAVFCQRCGHRLVADAPSQSWPEGAEPPPPGATAPAGTGPTPGTTPLAPGAPPGTAEGVGPPAGAAPPPPPPTQPVAVPGPGPAEALATGWPTALGRAAVTFLVMLLLGQGVWALLYASEPGDLAVRDLLKIGGMFTYAFHRVGVVVDLPEFAFPGSEEAGIPGLGSISLRFTVALAMLAGTVLLVWLLYRAGKALGDRSGGSPWIRGLAGAKIALPYAVITFLVSLLLRFTFPVPEVPGFTGGGEVSVHPSYVAAFVWPLVLGLIAGFSGGAASAGVEGWGRFDPWGSRLRGAVAGGWRMLVWGLVLSFGGLLVHAVVTPDATRAYFDAAFRDDALTGISVIVLTLLFVPNMAALVLAGSMYSQLGLYGGGASVTLLSYTNWPRGFNPEAVQQAIPGLGGVPPDLFDFGTAPWGYFFFLLVPILAGLLGGRAAAGRAGVATRGEGAGVGALAGAVFAVLTVLAALMAGFAVRVQAGIAGLPQDQSAVIGAAFLRTFLVALAWGAIVGALGGMLAWRRAAPPPGHAVGFADSPPPAPTQPLPTAPGPPPAAPPPPAPGTPAEPGSPTEQIPAPERPPPGEEPDRPG